MSKPCLISEAVITIVDSLAFDNVQALERSDCIQTSLIVGIASRISCVALIYVFAFLGIDVFGVADGTSKGCGEAEEDKFMDGSFTLSGEVLIRVARIVCGILGKFCRNRFILVILSTTHGWNEIY